ncbi:sigma-70 family RNA polymerase sigma factor [Kribbella jejuensis]|uniref:RNA polymerase sigma factor n=1 Tax=Kribbella jejuensis TaxID=236068 RepID=A0A542ET36_9ACTN|nr:sigma-70 family RNA polymerase sigma factor [Kribbella jejuensis]TQJ18346.1 RNA polymerase sigma-70 factor (ECF subfamily) [Kribbella jejuensis]
MRTVVESEAGSEDFGTLSEPFRRELLAYCYRMLGSVHEAEEVVQDVLLDAWRAYDRFEGRSSLRTWLYRIAARACLKALEKGRRRPLPADLGAPDSSPDARLVQQSPEVPWLQPIPDYLFTAAPVDPETAVVERQTMRLALVGALQQLPPRQRAVLILRDVLQWRAAEVAELLDMTTAAVNSALQRARAVVPLSEDSVTEPSEPQQRALLDRYAKAFETADVDQLVAVLTEDARLEMPPIDNWFEGRDTIVAFLAKQMRTIGPAELVATSANGQPAFAVYARGADGTYRPHALHVLTLTPHGVSRIVAYHGPGLFPLFGL